MLRAATGIHSSDDGSTAAVSATADALNKLRSADATVQPKLALVFVSTKYNYANVLTGVRSVVGQDCLIAGASTAGEITEAGPSKRASVAVMLISGEDLEIASVVSTDLTTDSLAAGVHAAQSLKDSLKDEMKLMMMFADGLQGNGSAIIRGIMSVLGNQFPLVGGSAADDGKFKQTNQFLDTTVYTNAVVGLGFGGNIAYSVGVNHGWTPVSVPQVVTSATGVKIHTLDNMPAIQLYESHLGVDEAQNLKDQTLGEIALSYPLGIKVPDSEEMLLRAPFGVDADGSIVCGGEVPVGSVVQLMVGTKEEAVKAATKAAHIAMDGLTKPPQAAIIFNCFVRNSLYANSDAAKEEINVIQEVIGKDVPMIGFYTYAEQAPVGGTTQNIHKCNPEFHNETIVVVLLSDAS